MRYTHTALICCVHDRFLQGVSTSFVSGASSAQEAVHLTSRSCLANVIITDMPVYMSSTVNAAAWMYWNEAVFYRVREHDIGDRLYIPPGSSPRRHTISVLDSASRCSRKSPGLQGKQLAGWCKHCCASY
eukprot:scpid56198/ scgid32434/ 